MSVLDEDGWVCGGFRVVALRGHGARSLVCFSFRAVQNPCAFRVSIPNVEDMRWYHMSSQLKFKIFLNQFT